MTWPDWGNVPSWLSVVAVGVAVATFMRSSSEKKREQIDDFSISGSIQLSKLKPELEGERYLEPEVVVKNGSRKHIRLVHIAYSAACMWQIADPKGDVMIIADGRSKQVRIRQGQKFSWYIFPNKQLTAEEESRIHLPALRVEPEPTADAVMHPAEAMMGIDHVHLVDHIGRRWILSPEGRRPSRRARWFRFYWHQLKIPHPDHPWHTNLSRRFMHIIIKWQAKAESSSLPIAIKHVHCGPNGKLEAIIIPLGVAESSQAAKGAAPTEE